MLAWGLCLPQTASAQEVASATARVPLAQAVPAAVTHAALLGRMSQSAPVTLALTLPLRSQAALEDLLRRLSDPADPAYGHYLTTAEFTAQFGPTAEDYAAVAAYARSQGLAVTGTHANRLLLDVTGTAASVETAFGVHLNQYAASDGHVFHAPDSVPSVPFALAGRLTGVVGLTNSALRRRYDVRALANPASTGTGPLGGLSPTNIKTAYNLSGVSLNGSGQTLAVFEYDGYKATDISAYEHQFSLPAVPLQNVLLDSFSGQAGINADEATLDIELAIALASSVRQVLVYETPNTNAGTLDGYSRIAEDNQAKQISTSWGLDEEENDPSVLQSENTIFAQMAAQGQTFYASAGDNGAYDSGLTSDGLRVDDPASQPYVCGVGGTSLTTQRAGGAWKSETVWNAGSVSAGAGGGGISTIWPIPTWQQGVVSAASKGSTTLRNVPDVSLNADPGTAYAIYTGGKWAVYGGVSCSCPLWASFTALVNQQRAANGLPTLGQANPALYPLLGSARYAQDFHDIADGRTNLYYPAVTGYDDATGLGSFNGANLLTDLTGVAQTTPPPAGPTIASYPAGLNLFSLPYDYSGVVLSTLFGYSGVKLAAWSPTLLQYVLTPTAPADQIRLGQGYWARFPQAVTVSVMGVAADTSKPFSLSLATGWNQIGDPFPANIPISSLQVISGTQPYSFADASGSAGLISGTLYRYDPGSSAYVTLGSSDTLQPGSGFWIYAAGNVTLQIPSP